MQNLSISITTKGSLEEVKNRVIEAIKPAGFGVLTQIDFDKKIKEKIGKDIRPCTILGACNPHLAYEAYQQSQDVALLLPCNIVLTQIDDGKIRIEAMRPTQMLNMVPNVKCHESILKAEENLKKSLISLE